jgi:hypothetical protein
MYGGHLMIALLLAAAVRSRLPTASLALGGAAIITWLLLFVRSIIIMQINDNSELLPSDYLAIALQLIFDIVFLMVVPVVTVLTAQRLVKKITNTLAKA